MGRHLELIQHEEGVQVAQAGCAHGAANAHACRQAGAVWEQGVGDVQGRGWE